MFDTDVFVLGGGPAGLAAAIAARAKGLSVTLADAAHPPIDKACGEGLMPDALAAAARLGVRIRADSGHPFRGIRFQGAGHSVASDFPNGPGFGVKRVVLQQALADAAERSGVRLLWGTSIADPTKLNARWIVGADGTQSLLRRRVGLHRFVRNSQRFSYRVHYAVAPWSGYMEIHWGESCQFYVTPVSPSEVCLVLMSRDPHLRISAALNNFPALAKRLSGAVISNPERGALAATRKLRRVTKGNVALIGDAAGTVDPITGEGMCLAFRHAHALADALVSGNLDSYERAHRAITRRPRFMSDFMLLMDKSNTLRCKTLAAFECRPDLFTNLLAMHVGRLNPLDFVATTAALGWKIATV